MVKRILSILTWTVSAVAVIMLYGFAYENYRHELVTDVKVRIERNGVKGFLEYEAIEKSLNNTNDSLIGKHFRNLDIKALQKVTQKNPWVAQSNIATGIDGVLRVKLVERDAIIRVFSNTNHAVYIDTYGNIFPLNSDFTPRVLIASGYNNFPRIQGNQVGHVNDSVFSKTHLPELYALAKILRQDDFLNALIDQVYINNKKELELIPKIGRAVVIIGDLSDIEEKLDKLQLYYRKSAHDPAMLNYRSINLTFRNQIVCTKI